VPEDDIEQVLAEHTDRWMQIPGVVGTAISLHEGKPCILIMTSIDAEQIRPQIPLNIAGYPVIIENTGEFRASGPE
jgi:hypothetical protein